MKTKVTPATKEPKAAARSAVQAVPLGEGSLIKTKAVSRKIFHVQRRRKVTLNVLGGKAEERVTKTTSADGFTVYSSPMKPKRFSHERIAAAVAKLR